MKWPQKHNVLGVEISAITYDDALVFVTRAAINRTSACMTHLAVHGLIEGNRNAHYRRVINDFDIVAPDGQPVRYALSILHNVVLPDRCYGPEFMIRLCKRSEEENIGVYLYGSEPHVVQSLSEKLIARFPKLKIVGWEPSIFRPLSQIEDEELINRVNNSGAGIVFIGLGCPLQEQFALDHKGRMKAVKICVGAAFDFHAGNKKMAPVWMQRNSLEWFYRLLQEPRRLWKRYLVTNSIFLVHLLLQASGLKRF